MSAPAPARRWPDAEAVFMAALAQFGATTTWTGEDLQDDLPQIAVLRVGGDDDGISDRPIVQVAVYHHTYDQARLLAEDVRQHLLGLGCTRVVTADHPQGALVDQITTVSPPVRAAYDNPAARRKVMTFRAVWRRQPTFGG